MSDQETTSEAFARLLRESGVERVYVYPGGTIAPLIDALEEAGIELLVFRSEQGAGFAAIGDTRTTGQLAVVLVSSGPGLTNVLTPLADAFYDSVPILIIAGQVSTVDLHSGRLVRQRGFQETPTLALTSPISKFSEQITNENEALGKLREAIEHATSLRTGPSVIDYPIDIQRRPVSRERHRQINRLGGLRPPDLPNYSEADFFPVMEAFGRSKRRLVLLGHGARKGIDVADLANFIELHDLMVVTSFLGIGAFDSESERSLGYVGHTGHFAANQAVATCDFLLVLGARLDVRQTGTEVDDFARSAKVCWVDVDESELHNPRVKPDFIFRADVGGFLQEFSRVAGSLPAPSPDNSWRSQLREVKVSRREDRPRSQAMKASPRVMLEKLNRLVRDSKPIVVTGVGLHQHWVARHLSFGPRTAELLTSGGHGTMGFDIPASIGAKLSNPRRQVLCVVGDGSMYMNVQELGFVSDSGIDIRFIVINNGKLGIVAQFQRHNWGKEPTTGQFGGRSLAAIARGFGIHAREVLNQDEVEEALIWLLDGTGPRLIEVYVDPDAPISPMLLAGQKMDQMWVEEDSNV